MPQTLSPRSNPLRTFAAAAVFLAVYGGVFLLVLAPREMIQVQSGSVVPAADGPTSN